MAVLEEALADFSSQEYVLDGKSRPVLKCGRAGPAVIVIHEVYGFTENQARFCRWIGDAGFRVYSPILFGRPNPSNQETQSLGRILGLCVSREIYLFSQHRTSPVVEWLKELSRRAHTECGGPGVGVVGMCLTGGFALAMAVDQSVLCPVLAEPGLPATVPAALDLSRSDLDRIRGRVQTEDLEVRGYRFAGDKICRAARFDTLSNELGEGFVARTLPDSAGNPTSPFAKSKKPPHSVFTSDLIDEPGQPTRDAVDEVIAFFKRRLG
jgi:dienelactone hydrolase